MRDDATPIGFVIAGKIDKIDRLQGQLRVGGLVFTLSPSARLEEMVEGMAVLVGGHRTQDRRVAEYVIEPTHLLVVSATSPYIDGVGGEARLRGDAI
jgi:hypothetical protein